MTQTPPHFRTIIFFLPVIFLVFLISFTWRRSDIIPNILHCPQAQATRETGDQQNTTTAVTLKEEKEEKELVVLLWTWPFGTHFPLDTCQKVHGIPGCKLTVDRNVYNTADAVVMHHVDIMYDKKSLPQQQRPHHQHWVWFNMEPPLIIRNLHFLHNLFNMTMTFRQDSDIYRPYGRIQALKEPQNLTIPAKSKLVSWVVSQWYPGAPRIAYYEELKKHIPIDVYGKRNMKLSRDDFYSTISQYKFYLAFENSIYKDYITEKLWSNAFGSWAVPVVLGTSRKNYERFVPAEAFIHVDDFSSPKELAAYLLELDKDDEKYMRYFNWRAQYRVWMENGWDSSYCKVCRALRQAPVYQTIPSIANWFLDNWKF
ncbi:3-galactosyl-N-acetylglucosaminide 4-alpha-L-fucosyltransferase FUT3-like [Spea bombifrons]|uniref:3-galactosyl-N-acetylglucosaminide 4-alpha-L-fucosyltransferase FUT3-like n=1 Tax=Spea bombifrons TaxID=233779 RepID=UPI0023492817|nr:3-galactosyl-N-acetylglucosaminide 4-alpha-L-fucosyltransferase FUT3-like [Spea bombifrons]